MYSSYRLLYQQNQDQTPATTDNRKFLSGFVPFWKLKPQEENIACTTDKCQLDPSQLSNKDPTMWGPHLWYYLHNSTLSFPVNPSKEEMEGMREWLLNLPITIPCEKCRFHYKQYLDKHQNDLNEACTTRDKLFKFVVDIHNQVNKRNNKPIVSYEEAFKMYQENKRF